MLHENIAREEAQLQKLARVGTPQAIQMLRQYAQTHQDDAIRLSLANQAVNDAKEMHSKALAMLSGQQPPTVAQQVVQSIGGQGGAPMPPPGGPQAPMPPQGMPAAPPPGMQMPPPMPPAPQMPPPSGPGAAPPGISGLPAPNLQGMADGGIAGYADGGEVHMAVGGSAEEAAIRAQGRASGLSDVAIDNYIRDMRAAANVSQRNLPYTPAVPNAITAPNIRPMQSAYEMSANPPMMSNPRMTGETPAVGPDDPSQAFTRRNIAEAAARVPELRNFIARVENAAFVPPPASPAPPAPPVAENKKPPSEYKPAGIATLKAPTVPNIDTPRLVSTPYEVGEKPTVAASKADVGQLVDSSDLMTQVQSAQAGLKKMGEDLLKYYDEKKPTKDVFSETVKRLDKEDALAVDKKGQAQGMALMMAGFKMMESPYGGRGLGALLRNAGAGAKIGAENYSLAIDKLEAAADKRAQQRTTIEAAQDAAARGDFNARLGLMQQSQQLKAQADALGISAAQTVFGTNATVGANLYSNALSSYNTNKNVAAQLKSDENRAQFAVDSADKRAVFGAKMEMAKAQYEQAGANARALAPTPEMRMALALGGGNLEVGLRKAAEISAGKDNLGKLYVQSKADFDAKNPDPNKQFMSPQEFMTLYNQVTAMRSPPAPTGSPTGRIFQ
jgi:hypothetical protein